MNITQLIANTQFIKAKPEQFFHVLFITQRQWCDIYVFLQLKWSSHDKRAFYFEEANRQIHSKDKH